MTRAAAASAIALKDRASKLIATMTSNSGDETGHRLLWQTISVFTVKISGLVLAFGMNIVLARTMGVEGFGLFSFAFSVLMLLQILTPLGLEGVLVREVAASLQRGQPTRIKGLILFGGSAILLFSVIAVVIGYLAVWFFLPATWPYADTLLITLFALPAATLTVGTMAVLEAHRWPLISQLTGSVVRPLLVLIVVGALYVLGKGITAELTATIFVWAYVIAFLIAAGCLVYWLDKGIWRQPADIESRAWLAMAMGFALIHTGFAITEQTDILMLSALTDPASVGIYRAATRYAYLVSFALLAASIPLQPMISAAFARGDKVTLRKASRRVAEIALALGLPLALVMVIFSEQFMAVFGEAFKDGSTALIILVGAQMLNVLGGSVGYLMAMTGHERKVALAAGITGACNIMLNAILIPLFHMQGAAIATAISAAIWNLILIGWSIKHLSINPTLIGRQPRTRQEADRQPNTITAIDKEASKQVDRGVSF
jgi:O-antigen/teichoic acid export membrane protein